MEIELWRYSGDAKATLGILMLRRSWTWELLCFTCEDAFQLQKVMKQTRIPSGRYKIGMRTEGGMDNRYKTRYPDWHKGMLEVKDVPGFEFILIHCGNSSGDTEGCILIGEHRDERQRQVLRSRAAYERMYPRLIDAVKGEGLWITVKDLDLPVLPGP